MKQWVILAAALWLAACATVNPAEQRQRLSALMMSSGEVNPQGQIMVLASNSAGNPLSNAMMALATATVAQSNTEKALNQLMALPNINIGIHGASSAVDATLIKNALNRYTPRANPPTLFYYGTRSDQFAAIEELAKTKQVKFVYLVD
ncbi:hypothetical protein AB8Q18_07655 [Neisseriaceae bacterium CLB008]